MTSIHEVRSRVGNIRQDVEEVVGSLRKRTVRALPAGQPKQVDEVFDRISSVGHDVNETVGSWRADLEKQFRTLRETVDKRVTTIRKQTESRSRTLLAPVEEDVRKYVDGVFKRFQLPVALAGQFYDPAPHMVNVNWAPLVGALVMTKKAWDEFNPDEQKAMRAAAEVVGKQMRAQARKENVEAVEAMKKRGLTVHTPSPAELEAWEKLAESAYPTIRGKMVPADLFDEVRQLVAEYREKKP